MERRVLEDMTLIDPSNQQPVHLKRGECVVISPESTRDPTIYTDPDTYDGYRFYKLRFGSDRPDESSPEDQQGPEGEAAAPPVLSRKSLYQLTTLSPDHLGFGLGLHSCPGRFFVANELKIALCHLIMMYDWKLASTEKPAQPLNIGNTIMFDVRARILVKKRDEALPWCEKGKGVSSMVTETHLDL